MKQIFKIFLNTCLIIPCTLSVGGCNKDNPPANTPIIETWDGEISDVSEAIENVITIETAEELAGLAKNVNEGNSYKDITIKITTDMDLANKEWTPIGYGTSNGIGTIETGAAFEGILDGDNHTLYNLKITNFNKGGIANPNSSSGIGLVGHNRGQIKNLTIDTANIISNHYAGAISGFNIDSIIDNCHVKNAQINCIYSNSDESGDKSGGIVGYISKGLLENTTATISNCTVTNSTIKADRDAGQVIGCIAGDATQSNNSATNVNVLWNESGNTENKSNTNITNDIVGRIA